MTLYGIALMTRWLLLHLFWRVGRRLFLSYVMIGVLPFFLFGVLLLAIAYAIGGLMSQAALRGERQASLGQLETATLEYSMTGAKTAEALPSLEIYDSAKHTDASLPDWLKKKSVSSIAYRDHQTLLVVSRHVTDRNGETTRSIVFVQPIDKNWVDAIYEKDGMIVRVSDEKEGGKTHISAANGHVNGNISFSDEDTGRMVFRSLWPPLSNIVWADVTSLTDWHTGEDDESAPTAARSCRAFSV